MNAFCSPVPLLWIRRVNERLVNSRIGALGNYTHVGTEESIRLPHCELRPLRYSLRYCGFGMGSHYRNRPSAKVDPV